MRLQARENFVHEGKQVRIGAIFETATEAAGWYLVNQDMAIPYNLDDPADIPPPPESPEPEPEPEPEP